MGASTWTLAEVPPTDAPLVPVTTFNINLQVGNESPGGLAWFDGAWWSCMSNKVTMFDPVSLNISVTPVHCHGVVEIAPQLVVNAETIFGEGILFFDTATQVLQNNPASTSQEPWDTLTHGASDGNTLWVGWWAMDFLHVYDLTNGAYDTLPLGDFDHIIEGVGLKDGSLWLVDSGVTAADYRIRVHEIDPSTGATLSETAVGEYGTDVVGGLWCGVP